MTTIGATTLGEILPSSMGPTTLDAVADIVAPKKNAKRGESAAHERRESKEFERKEHMNQKAHEKRERVAAKKPAAAAKKPAAAAKKPVKKPAAAAKKPVKKPAAAAKKPVKKPAAAAKKPVKKPAAAAKTNTGRKNPDGLTIWKGPRGGLFVMKKGKKVSL
jgi:hypothetical protein